MTARKPLVNVGGQTQHLPEGDSLEGVISTNAENTFTALQTFQSTTNVATLGAELTTNGTFTGDATGWTLGTNWAYNSNNVRVTLDGATEGTLSQTIDVVSGTAYYITWSQANSVIGNGTIRPSIGAVNGQYVCPTATSAVTMAQVIVAGATGSLALMFAVTDATSTGTITVDTVTVKAITPVRPSVSYKDLTGNVMAELRHAGTANLGFGLDALEHCTTGQSNTAIGREALFRHVTSNSNTAIGYRALYSDVTGSDNTASGSFTLSSNTTGSQNTADGSSALYSNTTGGDNTASGYQALYFNTTGSQNTGVGLHALYNNSTGGSNTALGWRAGRYAGASTAVNQTSNNSLYLGYQTRASVNGNTNEVVIGYDTLGMGSNTITLGNTSITATWLRGPVVGTAALATTATAGFIWIPSCAGVPTGAPSAPYTNAAAMVADTTNNRLYVRVGTTWRYATLT